MSKHLSLEPRRAALAHGAVAWLESGPEDSALPPLVLLHGIGSCAASWRSQLESLSGSCRVLAWDAPGYGDSAPLAQEHPRAADYASAATAWLQAAGVQGPLIVGHSLGALMGAALAARADTRARALLLVSPAQGYGSAEPELRQKKYHERVHALTTLGARQLAEQRSTSLCAPAAAPRALAQVCDDMARVSMPGYGQAAWMLSNDQIDLHLATVTAPVAVLCGEADNITPPKGARALATRLGLPYTELAAVGHACFIEDPKAFDEALLGTLQALLKPTSTAWG